MQQIDYNPVKVQINIEEVESLENLAFRTVAFFYEDEGLDTPDELRVFELSDLPKNNFMHASKAYNFTRSVMRQNKGVQVILRKKRIGETYSEAYSRLSNEGYYFVVIESKNPNDILEFNSHISSELKLQFFSSDKDLTSVVRGRKLVYYYQPNFDDYLLYDTRDIVNTDLEYPIALTTGKVFYSTGIEDYWLFEDNQEDSVVDWDDSSNLLLEYQDISKQEADTLSTNYPEGSWIGRCAGTFPSRIQWLYKTLDGVDPFVLKEIPNLSNTSVMIKNDKVTVGTGATCQGYPIEQQVGLDWLKWAIERNCWNLLKTEEKINATNNGLLRFEQRLKEVLDEAVYQTLFSNYQITEKKLDRKNNKVSFKFTANLLHSILGVNKVEGYIYQ